MLQAIWDLKLEYGKISATDFSGLIYNACRNPAWRTKTGEPNAKFKNAAEVFLRELRRLENFTNPNAPYVPTN